MVGFNHTNNNQPTLFVGPTFAGSQFGNVGIGTIPTFFTLDVNGTVNATGGYSQISDRRYKENIAGLSDAMDRIRQIEGVQYTFNHSAFPEKNFVNGTRLGFIAQDLKKVVPEAVWEDSDGFYSVEYVAIIPVLVEALKEKDLQIQEIMKELEQIKNQHADRSNDVGGKGVNQVTDELEGYDLAQNRPNPFNGQTTIRYTMPEGATGAMLMLFDLNGAQVGQHSLLDSEGAVTITSDQLKPGQYIYSLVANGEVLLSKKMLLTQR